MKQENFKRELASLLKRYNAEINADIGFYSSSSIVVTFYRDDGTDAKIVEDLGRNVNKYLKYESEEK